jgi:hypothetical protein
MFVAPTTGSRQVFANPRQMWQITVEVAALSRANAEAWLGYLLSLNGPQGTFYMGDPVNTSPRGVGTGTPRVNGAGQSINTLVTDGWTTSQSGIMKAGDWLQVGAGSTQQLVKVTADANSDGFGNATLEIWPRIRTAFADNTSLYVTSPKGVFYLAQPISWDVDTDRITKGLSFTAVEAF